MITPLDIQNKEFTKGVRGYKEEEVDMFLDLITLDLEKIVKENVRLKAQTAALETELEKYKSSEGEIVAVLEKAQSLMNDISASSEKRAEVIIRNAQLDADLTVRTARDQALKLKEENDNLKVRYTAFKEKYKKMLEDELDNVEKIDSNFYAELNDRRAEELLRDTAAKVQESPDKEELPDEIAVMSMDDLRDIGSTPEAEAEEFADDRKTVVVDLSGRDGE
jgi:DivIVA domain